MASEREFEQLYKDIHLCRSCCRAIPSEVPRQLIPTSLKSDIVLIAQAPGEHGVRVSGIHWINPDGSLRATGRFLDRQLRQLGYSIDPKVDGLANVYSTNVLHCWTGRNRSDTGDRKPSSLELLNCRRWWLKEFVLIKPRIVLLVGGPAAECFEIACGGNRSFGKLLTSQGEILTLERVTVKRFVVPHPASRYRDKGKLYQEVIDLMGAALRA